MTTWPQPVWQALDRLAREDLANYRAHVFDREAFLGTARARRADQHRTEIDTLLAVEPNPTAEHVAHVLNPKKPELPHPNDVTQKAQNLMYALNDQNREPLPPPLTDCATCANTGVLETGTCLCARGRFVAFVRTLTHPLTKGA